MKVLLCTADFAHGITGSGGVARVIASMSGKDMLIDVVSDDKVNFTDKLKKRALGESWPILGYLIRSKRHCQLLRLAMQSNAYNVILFNDIWLAFYARKYIKRNKGDTVVIGFMHDDNTLQKSIFKLSFGKIISYEMRAFMERKVIKHLDAVLTNSDYLTQLMSRKYPGAQVFRLYYCAMNYAKIEFKPRLVNGSSLIKVLFIKSDFERGSLKELILALRQLNQYRFLATVVGPSLTNLRRKLGKLIEDTEQLSFQLLGEVDDRELITSLYQDHHLVCVPSTNEALGLVNAEALACGTPVVSSGRGGIPEVLDSGRGGWIASGTTPGELAKTISACIAHPDIALRKAHYGRKFVLQRFDMQTMRETLLTIFNKCIQQKRPLHK